MLFFVRSEMKGMPSLPPEQIMQLAVKEWETFISFEQQGKVLAGGAVAARKGGCGVFSVDSTEELIELLSQLPMFPFAEWDIMPLIGSEFALDAAKKSLAAVQTSKDV